MKVGDLVTAKCNYVRRDQLGVIIKRRRHNLGSGDVLYTYDILYPDDVVEIEENLLELAYAV